MSNHKNDDVGFIDLPPSADDISRKEAQIEEDKLDHQREEEKRKDKIRKVIDFGALALSILTVSFIVLIAGLAIPCHIVNATQSSWLAWLLSFFNCSFVTSILTQTVTGAVVTVLVSFYLRRLYLENKIKSP